MKLVYTWFHPIAFNAIRFVIASGVMVLVLRFLGISLRIDRKDFRGIVSLAFVSNALYPFLFVLGLNRTRAGNAGLLMALTPIFAYLIGVFKRRESFNVGVLVGIVISLGGVLALGLFGSGEVSWGDTWIGDLLMISSAFCWVWYCVYGLGWLRILCPAVHRLFLLRLGIRAEQDRSSPYISVQQRDPNHSFICRLAPVGRAALGCTTSWSDPGVDGRFHGPVAKTDGRSG